MLSGGERLFTCAHFSDTVTQFLLRLGQLLLFGMNAGLFLLLPLGPVLIRLLQFGGFTIQFCFQRLQGGLTLRALFGQRLHFLTLRFKGLAFLIQLHRQGLDLLLPVCKLLARGFLPPTVVDGFALQLFVIAVRPGADSDLIVIQPALKSGDRRIDRSEHIGE